MKILNLIDGKKTYITAAAVALLTFAKILGWITPSEFESVVGLFGALGLVTLRDAIKKIE